MLYALLHLLFGWDYIAWSNCIDDGVARVHKDGSGRVWYWRYRITKVADEIREPKQVLWLTCHPSKYNIAWNPMENLPVRKL